METTNNKKLFSGKRVFISGASSGIGRACALQFAEQGADLVLCARSERTLAEVSTEITARGGNEPFIIQLDVRKREEVFKAIASIPVRYRPIDILINNAGLSRGLDPLYEGNIDEWDEVIDTNIKGLLYVTRAILPEMVERNSGHVINLGSIAGHRVYKGGNVYCATKHAVDALTRGMKRDLEGTRVRVSAIDPGAVETNFSVTRFRGDSAKAAEVYDGIDPLIADDIAEIAIFIASRSAHINISDVIVLATDQASLL